MLKHILDYSMLFISYVFEQSFEHVHYSDSGSKELCEVLISLHRSWLQLSYIINGHNMQDEPNH